MNAIVQDAIEKGKQFLEENGRPIEKALLAFWFAQGDLQSVYTALEAYQNEDGGFGHAYEPDMRSPASSALATTEVLGILWWVGCSPEHPLVRKAVEYFLDTYHPKEKSWLFIPESAKDYPHAPWWEFNPSPAATFHNPRPQILSTLLRAKDQVPADLLAAVQQDVVEKFLLHTEAMEMHDLFNYQSLYRTPALPDAVKQPLAAYLPGIIKDVVSLDPAAWGGYVLRPYGVLEDLHDEFYPVVADVLPDSLIYLINEQEEDGSWPLTWNWGDKYPDVWPIAQKEWKSRITLENLHLLKHLGPLVLP